MNRTEFKIGFLCVLCGYLLSPLVTAAASDLDEFKVKREEPLALSAEFAESPRVTRRGDEVEIRFVTKGYCDATVAIEDEGGRIVRHLVSGVLGPNAPAPLERDSKAQCIVWDGKDDRGVYLDEKERLTVRVSLGLNPRFERTLYWSPHKRISQAAPLIQAGEAGVFVFEGTGVDTLKMFDRQGRYVRTVYPFPAERLGEVKGLDWYDFPQGMRLPLKKSLYQQTLLTSGDNCNYEDKLGRTGRAATGMAVRDGRIALAYLRLNRLATDSTTGGAALAGGQTGVTLKHFTIRYAYNETVRVGPTSAAISPDHKWVYLAGYSYRFSYNFDTLHGVMRMPLASDEDATRFVGSLDPKGNGTAPGEFGNATSVDVDSKGRVYVSDLMNDRVQVFSPDGTFLKAIPTFKPALVRLNRRNDEIYVFSWMVPSRLLMASDPPVVIQPAVRRYGPFEDPKELARYDLPLGPFRGRYGTYTGLEHPLWFNAEIDSWADPVTIWLGRECRNDNEAGVHPGDGGTTTRWETAGIKVLRPAGDRLEEVRDFGLEALKAAARAKPPTNAIQRLYAHPLTGKLYVAEADSGPTIKSSRQWLEIDPETGGIQVIDLPFNAMEGAFDLLGRVYLRNTDTIVRYEFPSFREVPWDYGERLRSVGDTIFGKYTAVAGGLVLPSKSPVCFHQGGIDVSPKGHVIASCAYRQVGTSRRHYLDSSESKVYQGTPYTPPLYPGRISNSTTPCIHVWDQHGRLLYEDAVPGVSQVDGVGLDRDDNIYLMHTPTRVLDGQKYFNEMSETVMKVRPSRVKVVGSSKGAPVPLAETDYPAEKPALHDSRLGLGWVEGAEWFYGGVGYGGFNTSHAGGGCACWFSRFALDYFARSIAPEPFQFGVAVLDTSGNLIVRIGKYGNVEDGVPLVRAGGPASPRSIGGDEVALFHDCYVGTHTDRRLFVSDVGNGRILSVKLDYHATERVALKDVPDAGKSDSTAESAEDAKNERE